MLSTPEMYAAFALVGALGLGLTRGLRALQARQQLVEARVVPDDRGDRRLLGLLRVAGAERGQQPRLRLGRSDEQQPRRTRVGAGGTEFHDVVDRPQLVVADRRREPAVLSPGLEQDQIERFFVERHGLLASWMACHTRSALAGMSSWRTPTWASASMTAFMTAGKAPPVPASPAPLAPSGLSLVGTGLLSMCMSGNVSPRGIA